MVYHRFQLPAFDAYAYVAMAERPSVFTVAPWGYRLLTPSLVWAAGGNPVRRFRQLTSAALVLAGALLYLWLRRRGFVPIAALLGVVAFALSPPFAQVVADPFYMEPVGIALTLAVLLTLEAGGGPGLLALFGVLLALAKDPSMVVALSPAVALAHGKRGGKAAWAAGASFLGPALALKPLLRAWWTPHIDSVTAPIDGALLAEAWRVFVEVWPATATAILVGGILPIALLGALRRRARPFLLRYGVSLALLLALPFVAWLYVPSRVPVPLFGDNVQRLLLYPLPFLIALALYAVDRVRPMTETAPPAPSWPRAIEWTAGAAAAVVLLAPFVLLDRYRRLDLQGSRDGPLVLGFSRETWRTATRLGRGETVTFTPESHRYAWGESDPGRLGRMRWFLRQGWGDQAHYGTSDIVMQAPAADLVLPVVETRDVEVTLRLAAPGRVIAVAVNGQDLDTLVGDAAATAKVIRVPAEMLVRGDNVLTLRATDGTPGARLESLTYRMAAER